MFRNPNRAACPDLVRSCTASAVVLLLVACTTTSGESTRIEATQQARTVEPAEQSVANAPPVPVPHTAATRDSSERDLTEEFSTQRHTLIVDRAPLREVLFALARDTDLQIDISGPIDGYVTINAVDETLPRLLDRIAMQTDIRHELSAGHLHIMADEPYTRTHSVPYVDIARSGESTMDSATRVGTSGVAGEQAGRGTVGNDSRTGLRNELDHRFWHRLEQNLIGLIDPAARKDGQTPHPDVIMNSEAGLVTVRATDALHRRIARYLERLLASARRQVLIEATVVEVRLSDRFQAGVDWSLISEGATGFDFIQNVSGTAFGAALQLPNPPGSGDPVATAGYASPDSRHGDFRALLQALETFGDVRVVSTPRVSALNNQLAMLKVVDNRVYFTVDIQRTTSDGITERVFETRVNTVPVGLVMTVIPHIDENGRVLMNVRPSVSRILGFVDDPNPELVQAGVQNRIPEVQVREMESLLRVESGEAAVLGGLMQDQIEQQERRVPLLGSLPFIGALFRYRDDIVSKSELVIFLRPTVTDTPRANGRHVIPADVELPLTESGSP